MPRTPNGSKHPAIAARNGLQQISDETGKGKLQDFEAYQQLSMPQQLFLTEYIYYRDAAKAAEVIGEDVQWLGNCAKVSPGFQELVEYVRDYPKELALAIAEEALPKSIMVLKSIMDDGNKGQQLQAAKQLREAALSLGDQPWFMQNSGINFNTLNIVGFDKSSQNGHQEIVDAGQ